MAVRQQTFHLYNQGWRSSSNGKKAATNLAKHKVSFEEAATVFGDTLGRIVPDPRHSSQEERARSLGTFQQWASAGSPVCGARRSYLHY